MVDINIQLPDQFFEEEERWGFTITKERKELWAIELDLLCEFDRVCKKLGLHYFIDSGTLLGAVRDGHFIPWDDDIDVVMLREDYDQLLEHGQAEFSSPIFLQNAYTDIDYRRGLSQLRRSDTTFVLRREIPKKLPFNQGICIDIFPLDGLAPDGNVEKQYAEKQVIRKKIGNLAKMPGHDPNDVRTLFRQYEQYCSQYRDVEYISPVMFRGTTEKIPVYKREFFTQTTELEFEGFKFPAPGRYEDILTCLYGSDYLTPQRIPTAHGDIIWDTNVPYKEILEKLYNDENPGR